MIPIKYTVRDRGATPRGMRKRLNAQKKDAWYEAATMYHREMTPKRFTEEHARRAGYTKRKRAYNRRKYKRFGHTRPLEFTGTAKRAVIREASITNTSNGAKVRYRGGRVFNFRNPKSEVNMLLEFTTVLQDEADQIADTFDKHLDRLLAADNQPND